VSNDQKSLCDCHSKHSEAILTLKKDVAINANKIDMMCPRGLFYWVSGFIITLCALAFGSLFTLQSKTTANIATISANATQTQAGITRILNLIDSGNFVSKQDLERDVKGIVRQELYFFIRENKEFKK
jgi:hypothetical protein